MTDQDILTQSEPDEEETATNVALFPPEFANSDANEEQLEASIRSSNASYALRRLEYDLQLLQSKWQTVEQQIAARDERIESLRQELDGLQRQNEALEAKNRQLERDLDERQRSESAAKARVEKAESTQSKLQAVLLESQSAQESLELELAGQRDLVQALQDEVGKKQRDPDLLEQNADRLSAIRDSIRDIDFEIDEHWRDQPAGLFEDSEDIFDVAPEGVMLKPDELFPDPEELAEHVIVREDDDRRELFRYPLSRTEMTIGRSSKADIRLNSKYISREHARVVVDDAGVLIQDAGSMNGFLVNSEPCTRHRLVHGDKLEIGKIKLRYLNNATS